MTAEELTEINNLKRAIDKYEQIIEIQKQISQSGKPGVLDDLFIRMIDDYQMKIPEDKAVIKVMFEAFEKHVMELKTKFVSLTIKDN